MHGPILQLFLLYHFVLVLLYGRQCQTWIKAGLASAAVEMETLKVIASHRSQ